ncbi:hypothetical protein D9M68_966890 [compost metagenome]
MSLMPGRTRPMSTSRPMPTMPTGQAMERASSWLAGCCHQATGTSSTGLATLKTALTTLTESPRSLLKPMVSRTSAVICSSCSGGIGEETSLPLLSVALRWLITTAALRRRTVPLASRTTFTVLSTS